MMGVAKVSRNRPAFVPLVNREGYINQEQFTQFYEKLRRHALYKARRYFKDAVLQEDAADEAVNIAVDEMWQSDCYDEETARTRIDSSLCQSSRTRKLEPVSVVGQEVENFHGYKVK